MKYSFSLLEVKSCIGHDLQLRKDHRLIVFDCTKAAMVGKLETLRHSMLT